MQDLFLEEAITNHVLPIDDRTDRAVQSGIGRAPRSNGRTHLVDGHEGMVGMAENVFINVHNRSLSITADVTIPDGGGKARSSRRAGGSADGAFI